jgi:hypothetical protein
MEQHLGIQLKDDHMLRKLILSVMAISTVTAYSFAESTINLTASNVSNYSFDIQPHVAHCHPAHQVNDCMKVDYKINVTTTDGIERSYATTETLQRSHYSNVSFEPTITPKEFAKVRERFYGFFGKQLAILGNLRDKVGLISIDKTKDGKTYCKTPRILMYLFDNPSEISKLDIFYDVVACP